MVGERDGSARSPAVRDGGAVDDGVQPTPDLTPRVGPTVAWIENRLFVYSGLNVGMSHFLDDAALVDVRSGAVETLPNPPFREPLGWRTAVAVDDAVVLIGSRCGEISDLDDVETCLPGSYAGAVYFGSPAGWRPLALPDSMTRAPIGTFAAVGATNDGRAVFVVRNDALTAEDVAITEYWTYRVATDAWERLPDPGVAGARACIAEDRLIVVTSAYLGMGAGFDATVSVMDLVGVPTWQQGPSQRIDLPMDDSAFDLYCVGGQAAVVSTIDALGYTFAYDPTSGRWSQAPPPPVQQFILARITAGAELLYLPDDPGAPVVSYEPAHGAWVRLHPPPRGIESGIWNGEAVVGYVGPPPERRGEDPLTRAASNDSGVFRYPPNQ